MNCLLTLLCRLFDDVSLGRRRSFYVATMLMIVAGTVAAFMPHYWLYVIVRVVNGAASCGVATIGFVLS